MPQPELSPEDLPLIRQGGVGKTEATLRRQAYNSYMAGEPRSAFPSEELELFLREHPPVIIDTPPQSMDEPRDDMNARFLREQYDNGGTR